MRPILPFLVIACAFACVSCASTGENRSVDFRGSYHSSPEMAEIDAELETLELETQALESSYNEIQSSVLSHAEFASANKNAEKLAIFINENNVLIVNGTAMSRNDFSLYADRSLPALCTPTPSISIDSRANYDTAAWVMDEIYQHGCQNVQVE